MFRKMSNVLLLITSTILTSLSMLFSPFLLTLILPPSMLELLEYQSWFLFGHLSFLYLITACFYWIVGSLIGIKAKNYKDAVIKAICVGFGLFFSFFIIGSLYNGAFIFAWMFQYFLFALPGVAIVIIPAVLICFIRPRVKLNRYVLLAISSVIIIAAYIPLSGVYANVGINTPDLDFMISTPAYKGVNQQIVKNSQFQLERDSAPDREDYFIGFGSFPAIAYCKESAMMVSEFCHQHLDMKKLNEQYDIMESVTSLSVEQSLKSLVTKNFFAYFTIYSDRYRDMRDNKRPTDIVILPGKPEESYLDNQGQMIEIMSAPIALDALVFIAHKDNPVDNLSLEQLRNIYAGNIKNWQELDGNNLGIKNYQRDDMSLTHRLLMKDMVMQGTPLTKPIQAKSLDTMYAAAYQNYPESIGYCLLSFLEKDGFRLNGEFKIFSINGIQPNEANIRNGTYPFITNFYAAIRKGEEDDSGGRFLEWILSDEGQACIRQAGYFSLN